MRRETSRQRHAIDLVLLVGERAVQPGVHECSRRCHAKVAAEPAVPVDLAVG